MRSYAHWLSFAKTESSARTSLTVRNKRFSTYEPAQRKRCSLIFWVRIHFCAKRVGALYIRQIFELFSTLKLSAFIVFISMNRTTLVKSILGVATLVVFGISSARATLLFSDSFEYPAGPLAGQGPPAGSPPGQTGWSVLAGDPQVSIAGLLFPGVFSAGGAAALSDVGSGGDNAIANFSTVSTGTVWISFLFQGSGSGYAVAGVGQYGPGWGLVYNKFVYGIDNDNGQQALTSISPSGGTDWLVVKLNFRTRIQSLFVNPTPALDAPRVPDATLTMPFTSFNQIRIGEGYNNTTNQFDEVRIGTKFADVRRGQ